jgi:hypothetical protein
VPELNDLDLAIELKPKEQNPEAHRSRCREQRAAAEAAGRRFQNMIDELFWPENRVRLYLKARSPRVSLHDIDEPQLLGAESRAVFTAEALYLPPEGRRVDFGSAL